MPIPYYTHLAEQNIRKPTPRVGGSNGTERATDRLPCKSLREQLTKSIPRQYPVITLYLQLESIGAAVDGRRTIGRFF